MKKKLYQVKTIEEAMSLAIKDFGLSETEITFTVISEKRGFLGLGRRIDVEAVVNVDGVEKGKTYLQTILDNGNIQGFIEKKVRGNHVAFNVEAGDHNGYLIGRNARTLNSLQLLTSIVINNYYSTDNAKTVLVDVGDYKKRREHNLERMATQYAKQVIKTKQKIQLDKLNAYERKIIHKKLSTWKEIKTYSVGDEPNRQIVIEIK